MSSTISDGMWQNTCSVQQHSHRVNQWRFPRSTAEGDSYNHRKQNCSTRRRTFPLNLDGASESIQATAWEQMQPTTHKQAPHHAFDGEKGSLPFEQACSTCSWQHQLLQVLEQGPQHPNLWIWWSSSLHVANSKAYAKNGRQILSSNLAW